MNYGWIWIMGECDLCLNVNYGWIFIMGGGKDTHTDRHTDKEYEYDFFGSIFCCGIQIQIYSGLPKMCQYEYKYIYLDWYSQIQILIQILSYSTL